MPTASALPLIIDITNPGKEGILQSFNNKLPATVPLFIRNDAEVVTLRFVQPSATSYRPWDDVDYSTAQTLLAMGDFDAIPSTGVFTLTYGANTTANLPTGSTAMVVATALNGLASIITAGGVTVTVPEPGVYLVLFNTNGTQTLFTGNASGLNPASTIVVSEVVVGNSTTPDQQLIEIFLNPYALNGTWSTFPVAAAQVATVSAGATVNITATTNSTVNLSALSATAGIVAGMSVTGAGIPTGTTLISINTGASTAVLSQAATASASGVALQFTNPNVQTITLNPVPYDGTFQITTPLLTTTALPAAATATQVQTALNALGASYTVTGNASGPYTITIPGTSTAYSVNVSGLIVPVGLTGTLNLSTFAMLEKFINSGLAELTLELECQVTPSGGGQSTPLQLSVLVNKNVINLSNITPSPNASLYYTKIQANLLFPVLTRQTPISVSTAGTTNLVQGNLSGGNSITTTFVTATAGSGAYSRTIALPAGVSGDIYRLNVSFPATNATLVFKDNLGNTLDTMVPTGTAFTSHLEFHFGTVWSEDFRTA